MPKILFIIIGNDIYIVNDVDATKSSL